MSNMNTKDLQDFRNFIKSNMHLFEKGNKEFSSYTFQYDQDIVLSSGHL